MRKPITLGAAILFAACGGDGGIDLASASPFCQQVIPAVEAFMSETEAARPTPSDDRYGGTVVVGGRAELVGGMNAAAPNDIVALQHQQFVNLMTLLDYDENGQARPYLAERWDIADDNSSITFHLRRDVRWHDGEQTDAHDVAFTWVTVTNPLTAFPNAAYWDHYVKGAEGVEVIDDFTVRILMEAHAEFLDPFRSVAILPEHLLGDVPAEELKQHPYGTRCPVGNGPFVFSEHLPNDRWVFEANPAFPEALGGRPYIDRYVYRVIPEQTTLLTELLTENVDVYIAPRPSQAEQILENPNLALLRFPFRSFVFVGWNSRRPQLADARVRRAITMGTNREEIVQALRQGYGMVANSSVPPFHWAYDASVGDVVQYDPAGARALLAEAGWIDRDGDGVRENEEGLRLSISIKANTGSQSRQDIAVFMQAQLADIGVEVQPVVVEWATLLDQINDSEARDFDGVVMAWLASFKVDDTDLFHSDRIDTPFAWAGTHNPEIDDLLSRLSAIVDRDEAAPLWKEYQHALAQEQPYTFFYYPERLDGVNRRLRGVEMDARGEWLNLKDWWIER
ncbi:MAG: hypothetical protein IIB90_17870 [Gemmatimonadetes bacterium]|nr:hypothetical protein [Gemmatimonadota bacterium]